MLIPHTLDDVADGPEGMGVSAFSRRALAFGRANLRCLDGFAASIADAKEKATTGKPGGNEAASDDRLDTHHSGTLSSTFPLDRYL